MVKITIELSEEYLAEMANPNNIAAKQQEGGGKNPLAILMSSVCFGILKKEVDKGKTEFVVNREELEDDKAKDLFDNRVDDICALATILQKKKEKEEE